MGIRALSPFAANSACSGDRAADGAACRIRFPAPAARMTVLSMSRSALQPWSMNRRRLSLREKTSCSRSEYRVFRSATKKRPISRSEHDYAPRSARVSDPAETSDRRSPCRFSDGL